MEAIDKSFPDITNLESVNVNRLGLSQEELDELYEDDPDEPWYNK